MIVEALVFSGTANPTHLIGNYDVGLIEEKLSKLTTPARRVPSGTGYAGFRISTDKNQELFRVFSGVVSMTLADGSITDLKDTEGLEEFFAEEMYESLCDLPEGFKPPFGP